MIHHFLINPAAGKGTLVAALKKKIIRVCDARGVNYRITPPHAVEMRPTMFGLPWNKARICSVFTPVAEMAPCARPSTARPFATGQSLP